MNSILLKEIHINLSKVTITKFYLRLGINKIIVIKIGQPAIQKETVILNQLLQSTPIQFAKRTNIKSCNQIANSNPNWRIQKNCKQNKI